MKIRKEKKKKVLQNQENKSIKEIEKAPQTGGGGGPVVGKCNICPCSREL